jgi:hypothetical protein
MTRLVLVQWSGWSLVIFSLTTGSTQKDQQPKISVILIRTCEIMIMNYDIDIHSNPNNLLLGARVVTGSPLPVSLLSLLTYGDLLIARFYLTIVQF